MCQCSAPHVPTQCAAIANAVRCAVNYMRAHSLGISAVTSRSLLFASPGDAMGGSTHLSTSHMKPIPAGGCVPAVGFCGSPSVHVAMQQLSTGMFVCLFS